MRFIMAHMTVEVEKSCNLSPASCRPKQAGGAVCRPQTLESGGQGKNNVPGQTKSKGSLSAPFCSVQALIILNDTHPHPGGPATLLSLFDSNGNLF